MIAATPTPWIRRLIVLARRRGPYAVIMVLLPGGSLIALLLWLYRNRGGGRSFVGGPLARLRTAIQGSALLPRG